MKYTYRIEQDECNDDGPRDWDNLGTMVCAHRRYNLGDEQLDRLEYWLSGMLVKLGLERTDKNGYYTIQWEDFITDLENGYKTAITKAWEILDPYIFVLDLYLYDHSGITINTTGFTCPWDSGQVGFIYVTKADVRKEWGVQRISSKLREQVFNSLRSEVEIYDQYLTGDVWYFSIEDENGGWVDSCGGFYGYDDCEREAKACRDYFQGEEDEKQIALRSLERG